MPAPSAVGFVLGIVALGLGLVVVGETQPEQNTATVSEIITAKLATPIVFIFYPLDLAIALNFRRDARI